MTWARTYISDQSITVHSILKREDGYVVLANLGDPGSFGAIFLFMKLYSDGSLNIAKSYHHHGAFRQTTCMARIGDDYLLAGFTLYEQNHAALLMRVDAHGAVVWEKIYRHAGYQIIPSALLITNDEDIVVTGRIEEKQTRQQDCWVAKLDSQGKIVWQVAYDYRSDKQAGIAAALSADKNILIAANAITSKKACDVWILDLENANGKLRSHTKIGGAGNDQVTTMVSSSHNVAQGDTSIVVAGFTNSRAPGHIDILLMKCLLSGQTGKVSNIWSNAYELFGRAYGYSVEQTGDGAYLVAGSGLMPQTNSLDSVFLKIDPGSGSVIWDRGYGGSQCDDGIFHIKETSNNDFVACGYNESFPEVSYVDPLTRITRRRHNGWVMELDQLGAFKGDASCMQLDRTKPTVHHLDWIPDCNTPPGPVSRQTDITAVSVTSSITELAIETWRLCDELPTP